jgi:hypothetical protein
MSNESTPSSDELTAEAAEALQPPREKYEVVNPLFKRGRLWKKGTRIDLDADTASRFLETGDIKEIK